MASNQTSSNGLSQWEATDAVQRLEFNADNAKVDAALQSLSDQVVQKANQSALNTVISAVNQKADAATVSSLSQVVAGKAEQSSLDALGAAVDLKADQTALEAAISTIPRIVTGTYTGDGAMSRTISLGFTPKAVFVITAHGQVYDFYSGRLYYGGLALQGHPLQWINPTVDEKAMEIVDGGFMVFYNTIYNGQNSYTNVEGTEYYYMALG